MFDLPGVDPAGTEITVEKNVLTVRAERPAADTEGRTAGQVEAPAIPGQSETAKAAKEPAGAAGR
jgi:HSP20 family molecular chaperone IbpA